jgi:hypothetical protein
MKLKNFLNEITLIGVEICESYGLIYNVYDINNVCSGLNIDTSMVPSGTKLTYRTDFVLENDILTVAGISINTNDVTMLGM